MHEQVEVIVVRRSSFVEKSGGPLRNTPTLIPARSRERIVRARHDQQNAGCSVEFNDDGLLRAANDRQRSKPIRVPVTEHYCVDGDAGFADERHPQRRLEVGSCNADVPRCLRRQLVLGLDWRRSRLGVDIGLC